MMENCKKIETAFQKNPAAIEAVFSDYFKTREEIERYFQLFFPRALEVFESIRKAGLYSADERVMADSIITYPERERELLRFIGILNSSMISLNMLQLGELARRAEAQCEDASADPLASGANPHMAGLIAEHIAPLAAEADNMSALSRNYERACEYRADAEVTNNGEYANDYIAMLRRMDERLFARYVAMHNIPEEERNALRRNFSDPSHPLVSDRVVRLRELQKQHGLGERLRARLGEILER